MEVLEDTKDLEPPAKALIEAFNKRGLTKMDMFIVLKGQGYRIILEKLEDDNA